MPERYKDNRTAWEELNPDWVCLDWYFGLPWMRNADLFHGCGVTWMPNRGDAKEAIRGEPILFRDFFHLKFPNNFGSIL